MNPPPLVEIISYACTCVRGFHDLFFFFSSKPHPLGRVKESLSRYEDETILRAKYWYIGAVANVIIIIYTSQSSRTERKRILVSVSRD